MKTPAFDKPLLILGRENSNRSVSGDAVVVEVLPKAQWRAPTSKVMDEEEVNRNDNAENEESGDVIVTESERKALQEDVKHAQAAGAENRGSTYGTNHWYRAAQLETVRWHGRLCSRCIWQPTDSCLPVADGQEDPQSQDTHSSSF